MNHTHEIEDLKSRVDQLEYRLVRLLNKNFDMHYNFKKVDTDNTLEDTMKYWKDLVAKGEK